MDATTIRATIRPTTGRTVLAAVAMALVAVALSAHAAWAADASTINANATQIARNCAGVGGTMEWENGYDDDGNLVSQWAFCTLGDSTMACEYSGEDPICLTFVTTGGLPGGGIAAPRGGGVASDAGVGIEPTPAPTLVVRASGSEAGLVTDDQP